jgi:hypothetical protein
LRESVRASHEVDWTSELCMPTRSTGYRVTHDVCPNPFPYPGITYSNRPSPDPCESGSFSRALSPLRSCCAYPPGHSFQSDLSCRGFVPLRDVATRCPLGAGALRLPLCSVLRFSQPLDGLLHLATLRAYYIPQPRPGFSVQGFLPVHSRPDSSPGRAPVPFPSGYSLASQLPCPNGPTSRP